MAATLSSCSEAQTAGSFAAGVERVLSMQEGRLMLFTRHASKERPLAFHYWLFVWKIGGALVGLVYTLVCGMALSFDGCTYGPDDSQY